MRIVSGRHRIAENYFRTKHVVAAGGSAWDAGSTPAASSLRSERSENEGCRAAARFWGEGGLWLQTDERSELRPGKPV